MGLAVAVAQLAAAMVVVRVAMVVAAAEVDTAEGAEVVGMVVVVAAVPILTHLRLQHLSKFLELLVQMARQMEKFLSNQFQNLPH